MLLRGEMGKGCRQPKNLIILGKLEPSVGWNRSEYFFIFVSRTIQSYLDCILLEYSSLSWCTRAQMFYQLEGNETLSNNSHIFICIPSEPQWKTKDLYISNSSLRVDFLWRIIFTCLGTDHLKSYGKGGGEFSSRRNFFPLSNSLYEFFFLGHSMNICLGLIGVQEFFFS